MRIEGRKMCKQKAALPLTNFAYFNLYYMFYFEFRHTGYALQYEFRLFTPAGVLYHSIITNTPYFNCALPYNPYVSSAFHIDTILTNNSFVHTVTTSNIRVNNPLPK